MLSRGPANTYGINKKEYTGTLPGAAETYVLKERCRQSGGEDKARIRGITGEGESQW